MTEQIPCHEGFTWITPCLIVKDADTAVAFYIKAFGFQKIDMVAGEDGSTFHAEIKYKSQMIMLAKEGSFEGMAKAPVSINAESPMNLYVYCENVDEFYKTAVAAGAKSISEPQDMFWGDRMCRLKDLDGYAWAFATHQKSGC